jgi:hypothetical protein
MRPRLLHHRAPEMMVWHSQPPVSTLTPVRSLTIIGGGFVQQIADVVADIEATGQRHAVKVERNAAGAVIGLSVCALVEDQ